MPPLKFKYMITITDVGVNCRHVSKPLLQGSDGSPMFFKQDNYTTILIIRLHDSF